MPFRLCLFLLASLLASGAALARGPQDAPGRFDYYAVAMSWSPSWCATNHDPGQCASGRRLGFVLHGLWPQHDTGYPQHCSTEKLTPRLQDQVAPLFPSPRMAGHQWRKHGTCSGLDPAAYFALSARLKGQLVIPPAYREPAQPVRTTARDFTQSFRAANPGLASDSVLPFCSAGGRFLRELHACFDKAGRSRSCSPGQLRRSQNSCRDATFLLQSVR
jgi:ribonuclease T2